MKKLKYYLSFLVVLSMILCSAPIFTISAAQVTEIDEFIIETEVNFVGEDELQPMMAARCGPTYGLGNSSVVTGVIPDPSGHNQYGPCEYTIYYYSDGSSYGIYKYNHGTNHVQMYSDGTLYKSWWA